MATTLPETRERLKQALQAARAEQGGRNRVLRAHGAHGAHGPELVRLLSLLMVGVSGRGGQLIYPIAAGYGSEVTIEDLDTGDWFQHRLMTGDAMDLDAGHISLDSALGAALLGKHKGQVMRVQTPAGVRNVCLARLETLPAFLDRLDREKRTPHATQVPVLATRGPRTGTDG